MTPSSSPKLPRFVLAWIWTTAIGWVGGMPFAFVAVLAQVAVTAGSHNGQAVATQSERSWLFDLLCPGIVLAAVMVVSGVYGHTQWKVALYPFVSRRTWLAATLVSVLAGGEACIYCSVLLPKWFTVYEGNYSGLDTSLAVREPGLTSALILGIAVGFCSGFPQWWVLRTRLRHSILWLAAVTLASAAACAVTIPLVTIVKNVNISAALSCVVMPLVFGVITGIALYRLSRSALSRTM